MIKNDKNYRLNESSLVVMIAFPVKLTTKNAIFVDASSWLSEPVFLLLQS